MFKIVERKLKHVSNILINIKLIDEWMNDWIFKTVKFDLDLESVINLIFIPF